MTGESGNGGAKIGLGGVKIELGGAKIRRNGAKIELGGAKIRRNGAIIVRFSLARANKTEKNDRRALIPYSFAFLCAFAPLR